MAFPVASVMQRIIALTAIPDRACFKIPVRAGPEISLIIDRNLAWHRSVASSLASIQCRRASIGKARFSRMNLSPFRWQTIVLKIENHTVLASRLRKRGQIGQRGKVQVRGLVL